MVGSIGPKSSLSCAVVLRSIRHLSSMTSVPRRVGPEGWSEPDESDDARASATSHLFPCSSTTTRLWLVASSEVSRYTSIINGGGRLSKLPQVFQVRSSSRKSSKSRVSIWNCNDADQSVGSLDRRQEYSSIPIYSSLSFRVARCGSAAFATRESERLI